jgi:CheY-like chemotaxis protein
MFGAPPSPECKNLPAARVFRHSRRALASACTGIGGCAAAVPVRADIRRCGGCVRLRRGSWIRTTEIPLFPGNSFQSAFEAWFSYIWTGVKNMKKVLVIDDDPVIVAIYRKMFEAQDFEVESAVDGEQGFLAVERFKPDIVLLDLNMPTVSGTEWLRRVRAQPGLSKLPVVVLTAGTFGSQVQAAAEAGATQILSKARKDAKQVVDVVRSALAGNQ